jgi:PKHD-type hydroxylase
MQYDWYNYHEVYTLDQCKAIYDHLLENKIVAVDRASKLKKVNVSVSETKTVEPMIERFLRNVEVANEEYFGFDLFGRPRTVNLNVYENGMHYPMHRDSAGLGSARDLKLTAILNLSFEPFSGGDLLLSYDREVMMEDVRVTGNMIVFPTFLFHKVTPVTKGRRISLSAWFSGPNWR